jgi:hypothetical protein
VPDSKFGVSFCSFLDAAEEKRRDDAREAAQTFFKKYQHSSLCAKPYDDTLTFGLFEKGEL